MKHFLIVLFCFIGLQSFGQSASDSTKVNHQIETKKIDIKHQIEYDVIVNYVTGEYYYVDKVPIEHINICFALTPRSIITATYIYR
jgi:hypothetical protein